MRVLLIASIVACVALGVAAHGGSGNRNCQWGSWSGWGECSSRLNVASGVASVGSRSRSRGFAVTRRGGGAPCRGPSGDSQTCQACSLTQWTQWSECDGTQRTRSATGLKMRDREHSSETRVCTALSVTAISQRALDAPIASGNGASGVRATVPLGLASSMFS